MSKQDDSTQSDSSGLAADLIRQKISNIYQGEPDATVEEQEVEELPAKQLTKHQAFLKDLTESGKTTAQVQTEWHNYYNQLPESEKHEVWQEFYANYGNTHQHKPPMHNQHYQPNQTVVGHVESEQSAPKHHKPKSVAELKHSLTKHSKNLEPKTTRARQHLKSLMFGLSMGMFVVLVMLFGFFNDRFIAPLITPSRNVSSTPIIVSLGSTAISKDPLIIIPKINVQLPVIYDEPSIEDAPLQQALERGVVHYATTPYPGQIGNGVIFGHSSGNILNRGRYKYAFTLLKHLEIGDTFMLQKDGKLYVYKIYKKHIVPPTDLSVLDPQEKPSTFTLITCDPPGLSINRLIIVGEQISPSPNQNVASTATASAEKPSILPSNSVSLWQRLRSWL